MTRSPEFETHIGTIRGLAYRMLGSVSDADDIVQDAWLRWQAQNAGEIRNPRAWLIATTTRLCLDQLKSARRRREIYVGPWLPEPILTDEGAQAAGLEFAQDLSMALLIVLENLSAPERAAFLLHDVFDRDYDEIAEVLGRSEEAVRQLAARARRRVHDARPPSPPSAEQRRALIGAFLAAASAGDMAGLLAALSPDAQIRTDGGGKRKAALNIIRGADRCARFIVGILRKAPSGLVYQPREINGAPGLLVSRLGEIFLVADFEIAEGLIQAVNIVNNPDKLHHLNS